MKANQKMTISCSDLQVLKYANENLRSVIKDYINTERISTAEMSRRLGITQPNLCRYLNKKASVNSKTIEKIANYFLNENDK